MLAPPVKSGKRNRQSKHAGEPADTSQNLDSADPQTFTSQKLDWFVAVSIDPDLKSHDFEVAFVIGQCVSMTTGKAIIADDTIATYTRTSRHHVLRSRKRLRQSQWLDWTATRTANVYTMKQERVEQMLDLRTLYRDERAEKRFARLPSRQAVMQDAQLADDTVTQESQPGVHSEAQHDVTQESHTHLHCSTDTEHPEIDALPVVEEPYPAIAHPQIAETRLVEWLGDGDSERGAEIANAIGDARFASMQRQLQAGSLFPNSVRSAAQSGSTTIQRRLNPQ